MQLFTQNTLLAAKGGCICTPLTSPKSATVEADEKNIPKQELEDQPVYTKCYKWVRVKHDNTSNLLSHLCDNHPDEYAEASKFVHLKHITDQL